MPEDLKERTKRFSLTVIHQVKKLPKNYVASTLGKQLLRSATSVAANTRAAFRARSDKEYLAKIGIVIEEADESLFWIEFLKKPNSILVILLKLKKKQKNWLEFLLVLNQTKRNS